MEQKENEWHENKQLSEVHVTVSAALIPWGLESGS
jgi:hypothetical protein